MCLLHLSLICTFSSVVQSLIMLAIPGAVMTVLALLSCPIFIIGRCCCNCFGGRRRYTFFSLSCTVSHVFSSRNNGICCGDHKKFRGYSGRQILINKILVFVLLAGLAYVALFIPPCQPPSLSLSLSPFLALFHSLSPTLPHSLSVSSSVWLHSYLSFHPRLLFSP